MPDPNEVDGIAFRLHDAIAYNSEERAREVLTAASPENAASAVDHPGHGGYQELPDGTMCQATPLMRAVLEGKTNFVSLMIQHRPQHDGRESSWAPLRALLFAAEEGDELFVLLQPRMRDLVHDGTQAALGHALWFWAARNNFARVTQAFIKAQPSSIHLLDPPLPCIVVIDQLMVKPNPPERVPGGTALWKAAWHGSDKVVSVLLSAGARLSSKAGDGSVPSNLLAAACGLMEWRDGRQEEYTSSQRDYDGVVGHLLLDGEDPDPTAAEQPQVTRYREDPDPHAKHSLDLRFTRPAILQFASLGEVNIVQRLLQVDQDGNVRDKCDEGGRTLLHHAVLSGTPDMVDLALRNGSGSKVSRPDARHRHPIHDCISRTMSDHDRLEILRRLLQANADVNAKTVSGVTPLLMAAHRQQHEIVQELLRAGANLDTTLPIETTAWEGLEDVYQEINDYRFTGHPGPDHRPHGNFVASSPLLAALHHVSGFSPLSAVRHVSGCSPLSAACRMVSGLLKAGASMTAFSFLAFRTEHWPFGGSLNLSRSPWRWSVERVYPYQFSMKILSQSDFIRPDDRDEIDGCFGEILVALKRGYPADNIPQSVVDDCLRLLCAPRPGSATVEHFMSWDAPDWVVSNLVNLGANPLMKMPGGATLLHIHCGYNRGGIKPHEEQRARDMICQLVSLGADPNAQDDFGRTPLHYAAVYKPAAVAPLLECQADAALPDRFCRSPYEYAIANHRQFNPTSAELMLRYGFGRGHLIFERLLRRACTGNGWQDDNDNGSSLAADQRRAADWIVRVGMKTDWWFLGGIDPLSGDTDLHAACKSRSLIPLRAICKASVDWQAFSMQDRNGRTPLMLAVLRWDADERVALVLGGIAASVARPDAELVRHDQASTECVVGIRRRYTCQDLDGTYIVVDEPAMCYRLRESAVCRHLGSEWSPFEIPIGKSSAFLQDGSRHEGPDKPLSEADETAVIEGNRDIPADARAQCLNMRDVAGWTALHYAVSRRNTEVVRLLLGEEGLIVDESKESTYGAPLPLELAEGNRDSECRRLVSEAIAKQVELRTTAAFFRRWDPTPSSGVK
jgi:ankyrin repeat protein